MTVVQIVQQQQDEGGVIGEITTSTNTSISAWNRFWSKVEYLAVSYFQQSTASELLSSCNNNNNYVLHGLLQCNVPVNLFRVCLKYRPTTALAIDVHGNSPLHVLVENRPYRL